MAILSYGDIPTAIVLPARRYHLAVIVCPAMLDCSTAAAENAAAQSRAFIAWRTAVTEGRIAAIEDAAAPSLAQTTALKGRAAAAELRAAAAEAAAAASREAAAHAPPPPPPPTPNPTLTDSVDSEAAAPACGAGR